MNRRETADLHLRAECKTIPTAPAALRAGRLFTSVRTCEVFGAARGFSDYYDGVVVYDPQKRYTVNLASSRTSRGPTSG